MTPLAAASRVHGIARRKLRDLVSRGGFPLNKLGRTAVLPADAEKQLHHRIIPLQEVGFELTRNHVSRFAVKICKEHSIQIPWKDRMVGKG